MLVNIGLFSLLGICSIEDIRQKHIHSLVVAVFGLLGLFLNIFVLRTNPLTYIMGITAGIVLYILAVLTKEKIGKGDALIVGVTGIYLGLSGAVQLVWLSSVLAAVYGVIIMIFNNKNKEYEIPYVPFLLIAFVIRLIVISVGGTI